jgi:two-component system sensor histidine kinase KdpD
MSAEPNNSGRIVEAAARPETAHRETIRIEMKPGEARAEARQLDMSSPLEGPTPETGGLDVPEIVGDRIHALEVFVAVLSVLVVSLGSFQLHFTLPVTGFELFLIIVIAALRLGFWQATVTSVVAVICLDFFFTEPLFSLKTDAAGLMGLGAFESAALVVSRLSAQVQLQAQIARQQRNNMERLYQLARNVLLVNRHEPVGPQIAAFIHQAIGVEAVALFDASTLQVCAAGKTEPMLGETARNAWLMDRNEDNLPGHMWSRVLRLGHKGTGAIALRADHLSPIVADAIASLAAIALERSRSLEKETRAEAGRQSEQLRTAVLDALAHAFKTPLTTILAASSGLLEGGTLTPQQTELISLIDDQSVVLNNLTTRLLQTARLEGAEIHLRQEECTLGELIDDVVEAFEPQFRSRPAHILVADTEVPVSGDCPLIVTALRQLIDNAIKYSDPHTGITIAAESSLDEILISVHNEGPAIRPEDRDRIFDRFYRSPGTEHRAAGTGLGLSIARKIAEAHQGRVWAGTGSAGATFYFALPLTRAGKPLSSGRAAKGVNDDPGAW